MAFTSTTTQPLTKPTSEKSQTHDLTAPLLSMLVLSVYAAQKSKKAFRKLKRKFLWTAFKLKMKSLFSKKAELSGNVVLYIILGVLIIALLIVSPIAALILLIIGLILVLTGII